MDLEHTTWAFGRQNANKVDIGHKHYLDISEADQEAWVGLETWVERHENRHGDWMVTSLRGEY